MPINSRASIFLIRLHFILIVMIRSIDLQNQCVCMALDLLFYSDSTQCMYITYSSVGAHIA